MAELKNIIFDLGGVLLDIDYYKTEKAFQQLGFAHFKNMYSQYKANAVFEKLETGHISNQAFYDEIIKEANTAINQQQIAQAWNAMLLNFRISSLLYLKELAKRYKLYLLSNTNAIHLQEVHKIFINQTGQASLDDYFTHAYYSNIVGLRKPDRDIFEFVLKDAGLIAAESIFIDDSFNNIDTAKKMGFMTHLLLPGERIEALPYYKV